MDGRRWVLPMVLAAVALGAAGDVTLAAETGSGSATQHGSADQAAALTQRGRSGSAGEGDAQISVSGSSSPLPLYTEDRSISHGDATLAAFGEAELTHFAGLAELPPDWTVSPPSAEPLLPRLVEPVVSITGPLAKPIVESVDTTLSPMIGPRDSMGTSDVEMPVVATAVNTTTQVVQDLTAESPSQTFENVGEALPVVQSHLNQVAGAGAPVPSPTDFVQNTMESTTSTFLAVTQAVETVAPGASPVLEPVDDLVTQLPTASQKITATANSTVQDAGQSVGGAVGAALALPSPGDGSNPLASQNDPPGARVSPIDSIIDHPIPSLPLSLPDTHDRVGTDAREGTLDATGASSWTTWINTDATRTTSPVTAAPGKHPSETAFVSRAEQFSIMLPAPLSVSSGPTPASPSSVPSPSLSWGGGGFGTAAALSLTTIAGLLALAAWRAILRDVCRLPTSIYQTVPTPPG